MRATRRYAACFLLAAAMTAPALAFEPAAPQGSDCDSLKAEPLNARVDFARDIQPFLGGLMDQVIVPRCESCHVIVIRGGMDLGPANVRTSLLGIDGQGQQSPNYPRLRIVPGDPYASLLFLRINCSNAAGSGGRMPPGSQGGELDPEFLHFEALMHDWIKAGALMPGGDRVFQSGFDDLR